MSTDPKTGSESRNILAMLALLGLRRPGAVLTAFALAAIVAGVLAMRIDISTSRSKLVDESDPYQQRVVAFEKQFGLPDSPVIVVEGGTAAERRALVDALSERLSAVNGLEGRVLARLGPDQVAETLLLQQPAKLSGLLPTEDGDNANEVRGQLERGLPGWLAVLNDQLEAGLDGDGAPPEQKDGFEPVATILAELDAELAGRPPPSGSFASAYEDNDRVDEMGYLVGRRGTHHLIGLFPDLPGDEGHQVEPLVRATREAIRDVEATPVAAGKSVYLTGLPAIVTDELEIVGHGLMVTAIASTLAIFTLLILAFRSLRHATLALLPIGAGTLLTLGAVRLLFGQLNLITASFVSVLLGLGIDFGVHLLARYGELRRDGLEPEPGMEGALLGAGPGLLTGATTTAAAFLAATTVEFTAFAELGVITAVGLALMFAAAFALIPPLFRYGEKTARPAPELPALARLLTPARTYSRPILAVVVLLSIGLATQVPKVHFNSRYFDFLPESTESAIGLAKLEQDGAMSPVFAAVSAPTIEAARDTAERLRNLPTVAAVDSPSDIVPALSDDDRSALRRLLPYLPRPGVLSKAASEPQIARAEVQRLIDNLDEIRFALMQTGSSAPAGKKRPIDEALEAAKALRTTLSGDDPAVVTRVAALERRIAGWLQRARPVADEVVAADAMPLSAIPPAMRRRFVSKNVEAPTVALYVWPSGDPWSVKNGKAFAADVEGVDPSASGLALTIPRHETMIVGGFRRAALISAGIVALLLLVAFRRLGDAVLAAVPVAIASLWTLGLMPMFGLSFNVANVVALPLMIGIGVDAGAHMIHRCRESAAAQSDGVARLDDLVRGTGGAVALSSVTTMAGFAALMAADYGAMKSLGLLLSLGIGVTLVATVLVLPALLTLLGRAR